MGNPTAVSSGAIAVGTVTLATGHNYVDSIILTADGTNAATVTVYDGTSATGTILAVVKVAAVSVYSHVAFSKALRADLGITAVVAGTGAVAYIGYGAT